MALFGEPNAFLGLDIGTSHIKLVELINRRRRIELVTYAQASLPNLLLHPAGSEDDAVIRTANVIAKMLDAAHVSADAVIAALPSSIVFSTVLTLPSLPEKEVNQAVHFAARDVVPGDITDMVLGWSRVGETPHMDTDKTLEAPSGGEAVSPGGPPVTPGGDGSIPIFVTAAPKNIVDRYLKVMSLLKLDLKALEVETFPLVRALFDNPAAASGLVIDIGDQTTAFHIIDGGIPRASRTIDYGGATITAALAEKLQVAPAAAEKQKITHGLSESAPEPVRQTIAVTLEPFFTQIRSLLEAYAVQSHHTLTQAVLIGGGGASLKGLDKVIAAKLSQRVVAGNPWRGLSFPQALASRLPALGPTFAVAVGLALRGARSVQ